MQRHSRKKYLTILYLKILLHYEYYYLYVMIFPYSLVMASKNFCSIIWYL